MFDGVCKLIDVNNLCCRGRGNCANHFLFWGLFRFFVLDRLALGWVDGLSSKDIATRFRMSSEADGRFALWRVSSRGRRVINDDGRSAVSANDGGYSCFCSYGSFGGITRVLGIRLEREIFASSFGTHISGELVTRRLRDRNQGDVQNGRDVGFTKRSPKFSAIAPFYTPGASIGFHMRVD